MDRYARGQFNVGYESRLDVQALRVARVEKAQRARREADLDALLVWKDENVRYLTDLRPQLIAGKSTVLNGALLLEGEAPILFCSGGEKNRVERTMPWITEAHIAPIMEERSLIAGFVKQVVGPVLSDRKLERCRLGVDEGSVAFFEELARQLPHVDVVDGDVAMQGSRRIKLPGEIVLLEEATAIGDAVTASAVRAVQEGVRENDVAADAMRTLYRLGGEYSHVTTPFVASGEHMSPPNRISSDKIIRNGDLVFIDIGASWGGYYGDVARTTICGNAVATPAGDLHGGPFGAAGRHRRDASGPHERRCGQSDQGRCRPVRLERSLPLPVHGPRRRHRLQRAALHRREPARLA